MADYKKIIFEGLRLKYHIFSDKDLEQKLLEELKCITGRDIMSMDVRYELDSYQYTSGLPDFIQDRIGEDFVVLENCTDHIFCIHEVDDFLTEIEKLQKMKNKKITTKDCNGYNIAA